MGWAGARARIAGCSIAIGAGLGVVAMVAPPAYAADAQPFSTMEAGYTQEIVGLLDNFAGGVAFAKDGDPWVNNCSSGGGPLHRIDLQTTLPAQNGTTTLHPETEFPSDSGCGLTNHPNGKLYTNTPSGVVALDAEDAHVVGGPFGDPGNVLGIAPDPITGNLVYVGSNGDLLQVDANLTTKSVFSTALQGQFLDGIYFDPTGNFLFTSDRSANSVSIVRRDGTLSQKVAIGREPDGMAFHAVGEQFVLTNNTDGTMTKITFAGNDFNAAPTVTQFASGGFRGDLSQVGPDGCLYLTQDGVRFADGTEGGSNSLVKICGGFSAPPGVATPTTTTTTTAAPPTTAALAAAATPTTVQAQAELPRTGDSRTVPLAMGAVFLVIGGALFGSLRKRRIEP